MKRAALSAIAAVLLSLGHASTASAHRLSTETARSAATDLARTVYMLQEKADKFAVRDCRREAAHRVRCRAVVIENFVSECTWWTAVGYRSHRARRIYVEVTDFQCFYDDDYEEFWERRTG